MAKKIDVVQSDHVSKKTFDYKKGNVNLNFTLRVDVQTELVSFKECMLKGVEDIEKEIQNLKNK